MYINTDLLIYAYVCTCMYADILCVFVCMHTTLIKTKHKKYMIFAFLCTIISLPGIHAWIDLILFFIRFCLSCTFKFFIHSFTVRVQKHYIIYNLLYPSFAISFISKYTYSLLTTNKYSHIFLITLSVWNPCSSCFLRKGSGE